MFFEPEENKAVCTNCGNIVFPQPAKVALANHHIITFMDQDQCVQIEAATRDQADSPVWIEERKNRLTASTFGLILKRRKITEKFIQSLMNPKSFSSAPTCYGKNHEKKAVAQYIKKTGNHVHECGLVVNGKFPFLGASPDGKVCEDGTSGLLEVKCPYSARDLTINDACMIAGFCLTKSNHDDTVSLNQDHQYYFQVQGQLLVTGAEFCDFVVFTKNDLFIQRIKPDVKFMQDMLDRLSDFYFQHIKPLLDAHSG